MYRPDMNPRPHSTLSLEARAAYLTRLATYGTATQRTSVGLAGELSIINGELQRRKTGKPRKADRKTV